ncbi:MAG: hypothetical protein Kow0022_12750 [Phycisphaerales bacterium]
MSCCGTGFCAGKFIAAIVAVGLGGYAAYNYATSGSLCASCSVDSSSPAAIQSVGAVEGSDACPMGACSQGKSAESCPAGMMEVAQTGEGAACDKPCDGGACDKPCSGGECDKPCDGACPKDAAGVVEAATTSESAPACHQDECEKGKEGVASSSTDESNG